MKDVVAELDDLYADGADISFQALRSIPRLESALKETLRLHPPLIILLRVVQEEIELAGHTIPPGTMVAASPRVSNRIAEDFPEPDRFDPGRYLDPRQEDLQNRWTWIPFGAGKHRCVGNAFAMMQLKAIFSVILRDYEFELAQPSRGLPRRRLQDGHPARPAVPGALPEEERWLSSPVACRSHRLTGDFGASTGKFRCRSAEVTG